MKRYFISLSTRHVFDTIDCKIFSFKEFKEKLNSAIASEYEKQKSWREYAVRKRQDFPYELPIEEEAKIEAIISQSERIIDLCRKNIWYMGQAYKKTNEK